VQHGLKPDVADVLVGDRYSTELFERTVALGAPAAPVANWITQDLAGLRNRAGTGVASKVEPEHLIDLIDLISQDELGGAGAKLALEDAFESGDPIAQIVERRGLRQISDTGALQAIADEVIADNPDVVAQFKAGKEATIGFLVGQVMKRSAGTANPKLAQQVLRERLKA
jgi:aspartyl-tRNA(Asn)/glutamyl-tRNA(Gln) amidotransferase subunit B